MPFLLLIPLATAGDFDAAAHMSALAPFCGQDVVVALAPDEAPTLDRAVDPPELAVVMRVHPYGLTIDGREISALGGTADLEATLRAKREAAESIGALAGPELQFKGRLMFIAHPAATGSTVVQLLDAAAKEGFTQVALVAHVADPPELPTLPESAWLAELDEAVAKLPPSRSRASSRRVCASRSGTASPCARPSPPRPAPRPS